MQLKINKAFESALHDTSRYLVLFGGAGSGKSVFGFQKILLRLLTEKKHRIVCIRKVRNTLRNSCYQLMLDLAGAIAEVNKTELRFTFPNGNELIMLGLDDSEKIKSIAGITSVIIEEATELSETDFTQLDLRLRGETANYKQIIVMFNPIDELHWLKERFFNSLSIDISIYKTTYKDNSFLDEEYKRVLNEQVRLNENLYKIYVLGEWGRHTTGGEFYKSFKLSKHIRPLKYNENLPLHLSFDFNVHPYVTCLVCQIEGKKVSIIDEICFSQPYNTTLDVCKEVAKSYKNHVSGVFVYGDPAGKHQDTREKDRNDFTIIKEGLMVFNPSFRISNSAPSVATRGSFINRIFSENYANIGILVGEKCQNMIADLNYVKESPDGTKLKEKVKDQKMGITYELYGHTSDALDYLICECFKTDFKNYTQGGAHKPLTVPRIGNVKRY